MSHPPLPSKISKGLSLPHGKGGSPETMTDLKLGVRELWP